MLLYSELAHMCINTVNALGLEEESRHYFKEHKGRVGYYPAQFVRKHRLPMALAARMSALFNMWRDRLDELKGRVTPVHWKRLDDCTFSYSSIAKYRTHCSSRLCPWCQAVNMMKFEHSLAAAGARGCTIRVFPISESLVVPKTPPGARLSFRAIAVQQGALCLNVAYFYKHQDEGDTQDLHHATRHLLRCNFSFLFGGFPEHLDQWIRFTSGLRSFTRPLKRVKRT
jgi:hypothetical protein